MTSESLYEVYHAACPFPHFGCDSFHADKAVAAYQDAKSVLDFGCGNGYAVKKMQNDGLNWSGVEVSRTAYDKHLQSPGFYLGSTDQFRDHQFDMTYSTEVLEHVPEESIAQVTADICRVTSKYIFMTISLRPSSRQQPISLHTEVTGLVEDKFTSNGFVVDRDVIDCYQRRTLKSTKRIFGKYADLGPIPKGFAEQPPYELHGEKEFWFFAFRREGVSARPLPEPTVPWVNRKVVPALRRVMHAA